MLAEPEAPAAEPAEPAEDVAEEPQPEQPQAEEPQQEDVPKSEEPLADEAPVAKGEEPPQPEPVDAAPGPEVTASAEGKEQGAAMSSTSSATDAWIRQDTIMTITYVGSAD